MWPDKYIWELPEASSSVGLLSLWLLEQVKDSYQKEGQRKKILSALLKTSTSIDGEFKSLMDKEVFISKRSPRRLGYVEQLTNLSCA